MRRKNSRHHSRVSKVYRYSVMLETGRGKQLKGNVEPGPEPVPGRIRHRHAHFRSNFHDPSSSKLAKDTTTTTTKYGGRMRGREEQDRRRRSGSTVNILPTAFSLSSLFSLSSRSYVSTTSFRSSPGPLPRRLRRLADVTRCIRSAPLPMSCFARGHVHTSPVIGSLFESRCQ